MVAFENIGNTCYFNSVMQILVHINTTLSKPKNQTSTNRQWINIICKLKKLSVEKVFNPKLLFEFLKWHNYFSKGQPHDVHESLLKIIEIVGYSSFSGKMLEVMTTPNAPFEHHFKSTEMNALELTITHNTLEKCFDEYFKTEEISGWKDSHNKERVLLKFSSIQKFPQNLVILLRQSYYNKKDLEYPLHMDISKYSSSSKNVKYKLSTVVIHRSAHYYTYCLENGKWFRYNDDERDEIRCSSKWIPNEAPYMLVYIQSTE